MREEGAGWAETVSRWGIPLLSLIGIGVSGYLTWSHLAGQSPYCGSYHGCETVQSSPYAEVGGVPVAAVGLLGYLILLGLSLLRGRVRGEMAFYLPVALFGVALIGFLYSLYLTYLEAFVIRAWCFWCVTSALVITAIFTLTVLDLGRAWEV
ncbi:MAG: vitamin K epoxide reductase family protein [Chloroflexi bacterium]|nr:MAG: vitamin K epoxide reductase family protein [Chloroflexota bacterium]